MDNYNFIADEQTWTYIYAVLIIIATIILNNNNNGPLGG